MTRTQPHLVLCELTDPGLPGLETYSPFCLKVHRGLRAAGLRYERRHAWRPDAFRNFNSAGQVPVLLVDGQPIADSTRILRPIDELTGALSVSQSPEQRAEAWLWEEFADVVLSAHLVSARWVDERNWSHTREALFSSAPWFVRTVVVPQIRKGILRGLVARDITRQGWDACWDRYLTLLDELELRAPERGFWVSDTLSVADLGLFGQLHSLRTPLTRPQAGELSQRMRLSAYLERVNAATQSQPTTARSAARPVNSAHSL